MSLSSENLNTFITALHTRYATKKFDSSKKIADELFDQIMDAVRLSPSSFGLQPWRFVVVKNPELREQLAPAAYGQTQVTDASHLVVLCRYETFAPTLVEEYVADVAKTRGMDVAMLEGYKQTMLGFVAHKSADELAVWMSKQVYIALGFLLSASAVAGVDACPMEGFNPTEFDRILGLEAQGLKSVVACPVGYRSDEDMMASLAKVRLPLEQVVVTID